MFARSLLALLYSVVPSLHQSHPAAPFHPKQHPSKGEFTKFADPLPIPAHLVAKTGKEGKPAEMTVKLTQFQTSIHSALPEQPMWGYNGTSPGPVIDVEKDQKVIIHWLNNLPSKHIFPVAKLDLFLRLGLCLPTTPDVRNVTHMHGAEVEATDPNDHVHNNDGWPDAWTLPGGEQIAEYPNHQNARTMWFHDHAMGTTARNVSAGLAGFYFIHDSYERSLNLPSGKYEVPLMITSHSIDDDGKLIYTDDPMIEYYGNTVSVNGKLWPYLNVEPRKYRFRIVNGSNARSYKMKITDENEMGGGPDLNQIGTDSGFLEKTVVFSSDDEDQNASRLLLAPGERADVIVDFSKFAGKTLILHNTSRDPGDGEIAMPEIMQFRVGNKARTKDTSNLPMVMKPIERIPEATATVTRQITFGEKEMPSGDTMSVLNGKLWHDPVEEKPLLGATEIWNLVNTLPDVHPFHIHLVQFQVLDRTPYDVEEFLKSGKIVLTGPSVQPDANEMGWKDTVRLNGGTVTRIITKFLPYPGFYVYHCHILEHEDMDMMRPFQVVDPNASH